MALVDSLQGINNIGAFSNNNSSFRNSLLTLGRLNKRLAKAHNSLATGRRINEAADDPSGVVAAAQFQAHSKGLKTAKFLVDDAQNMLSVAAGGLRKILEILINMRSKAQQAASDTFSANERVIIEAQLTQATTEIDTIVGQTTWNQKKLLNGLSDFNNNRIALQTGPNIGNITILGGESDFGSIEVNGGALWNLVSPELNFINVVRAADPGVQGLNDPNSLLVSPGGQHVYVAGSSDDAIAVLSRDSATGRLSYSKVISGIDGLRGVRDLAISPGGGHVYAVGRLDDAIVVFGRDEITGDLTFAETVKDTDPGVDGLDLPRYVSISPDGKQVYVSSSAAGSNAVSVFSRDETTGILTLQQVVRNGDASGAGTVEGLDEPGPVAFSPDGLYAYVPGANDNALVVFARDTTTGDLTFKQAIRDTDPGIDGLSHPLAVKFSPDGKHAYVVGAGDNAVAVFSQNRTTGELAFVDIQKNGQNGISGLNGVYDLGVSPDSKYVYTVSRFDNTLSVFRRNQTTGGLILVSALEHGENDIEGLAGAVTLAISPDSKHIYTGAVNDDAVATFGFEGFAVDVSNATKAANYIGQVDDAIGVVNQRLQKIGSWQSRLAAKQDLLFSSLINTEAAYSRTLDADMARTHSEAVRLQLLQQNAINLLGGIVRNPLGLNQLNLNRYRAAPDSDQATSQQNKLSLWI